MFVQSELLKNKNKNLRKTRDLLLPKLINGEIDVEKLKILMSRDYSENLLVEQTTIELFQSLGYAYLDFFHKTFYYWNYTE